MKRVLRFLCLMGAVTVAGAQESVEARLSALAEQNRRLQEQVQAQQKLLDELAGQLKAVKQGGAQHEQALRELRESSAAPATAASAMVSRRDHEVRLSGEVGLAYFKTGPAGMAPKGIFRADDAKIFVEAPLVKDTYVFAGLDLTTREASDGYFELGEVYVDFENVSGRLGGMSRLLNVRAGRFYTPFGEEYALRGPLANPLISHSLADFWGIDAGLEAYGSLGAWQYAVAVQNGADDPFHKYNADKSVTGRIGWDPVGWLHLSASAMRTGELKTGPDTVTRDFLSNLWFSGAFFRSIGSDKTTSKFWADLWAGDATVRWKGGHASASAGAARISDNDRAANNTRLLHFGFVEAAQDLGGEFFGAARHSWIEAPRGYPMAGWGNAGRYFYSPVLSTELQRTSVGLGYRFGPPLVVKLEYTWESGRLVSGARRNQEDFFGAEAGLKF